MQGGASGDLAQDRAHEGLEGDLGADRVAGQAEDRGALDRPDAELAARGHGDGVEAHRAQGGQNVFDGVALPDAQAPGGDEDVGAHQLVLDGVGQGAQLVGDGGHPEGLAAGVGDRAGQGVAVGVEDVPGLAGLAGLDQLVPDGDHDDARGGAYAHPVHPEARQQGHMAGADARASLEDSRARLHVLGTAADIVAGRDGAVDGHPGLAAVGVGPGDDGVGAQRHGGAGVNEDGGTGDEVAGAHVAGAHRVDDVEHERVVAISLGDVLGDDRVAVLSSQVHGGQVDSGGDVLGQDASDGVGEDHVEGCCRLGDLQAGGQVLGHCSHGTQVTVRLTTCAVPRRDERFRHDASSPARMGP